MRVRRMVNYLGHFLDFLALKSTHTGTIPTEKRQDHVYEIEFHHVSFAYPGSTEPVLKDLSCKLTLKHKMAVVGLNGAGKTTFIKLLCRLYDPTEGYITLNGVDIRKYDYRQYQALFGVVFQDFQLFPFPVGQNVAASLHFDEERLWRCLEQAGVADRVRAMGQKLETPISAVDEAGENVSGGEAQKLAIARALYKDAPFVVLDEPTAALDPLSEYEIYSRFDELVRDKTSIYISHRMKEIFEICDDVTVFRDGQFIAEREVASLTEDSLIEMMVGRKVNLNVEKTPAQPGEVVLSARGVCVKGHGGSKNVVDHVDFDVRRGEIVCIAGIDGNGQTELVYALTGLVEPEEGTVTLNGQDITHAPIRRRNAGGLGHIPEDRHRHGLVLDYNLAYNLVLQSYFEPEFCSRGFLKYDAIYEYADKLIGKFDIRSGQGARTITRSMSGGNQQKAIVAREIDRDPDVLIAVQPTRGLDVGAIEYIHGKLVEERDAGKAILLVSLELDEVMQLSDRILVIYEGRIVADLDPKTVTVQELGLYMAGSGRRAVQ